MPKGFGGDDGDGPRSEDVWGTCMGSASMAKRMRKKADEYEAATRQMEERAKKFGNTDAGGGVWKVEK